MAFVKATKKNATMKMALTGPSGSGKTFSALLIAKGLGGRTALLDTEYGSVMDYFEIFLDRMILCRKAAERLGLRFKLIINGQPLI